MEKLRVFQNARRNYVYGCPTCRTEEEVARLVLHWSELFPEHGFDF
jgi:hypothetical protein